MFLIQVSKVVRAAEVSAEERRQIFDAVGFSFVDRLLNTSASLSRERESTAPGDGKEDGSCSSYQCLAISLLACFATDPQLVIEDW